MKVELTKFDELSRRSHFHIEPTDDVFYFGIYTPGAGYAHSEMNQFILNLKKSPTFKTSNPMAWRWKGRAIEEAASWIKAHEKEGRVWVPIPSSKAADHPEYDPRMEQVLISAGVSYLCVTAQIESTEPNHLSARRQSIEEVAGNWQVDEAACAKVQPEQLVICDDVIRVGTHFKAMQRVLNRVFPGVPVKGLFLARCVDDPAIEFEDLTV